MNNLNLIPGRVIQKNPYLPYATYGMGIFAPAIGHKEIVVLCTEHCQYFQGAGRESYEEAQVGAATNERASIEDALEQLAEEFDTDSLNGLLEPYSTEDEGITLSNSEFYVYSVVRASRADREGIYQVQNLEGEVLGYANLGFTTETVSASFHDLDGNLVGSLYLDNVTESTDVQGALEEASGFDTELKFVRCTYKSEKNLPL